MDLSLDFFDAKAAIGRGLKAHPKLPCTTADLSKEMQQCHVAQALVSLNEAKWWDPLLANRAVTKMRGNGCYPIWMALPNTAGDFISESKLVKELDNLSIPAVQIYPKSQSWNPFSRNTKTLFDALSEGGWPIFVSLGEELQIAELEELAGRFPNNKWIATNGGWFEQRAICQLLSSTSNVWITLERYHANFGIEHLCDLGLSERLLFGSNAPAASMGAARAYIDWAQIPLEAKKAIAGENLLNVLRGSFSESATGFVEPDAIMQDCMNGKPLGCGVIDCHSHILEDGIHTGGMPVMLKGDANGLQKMASITGVKQTGVMSWVGIQTAREEEGHFPVIQAVERWPEEFWGLATIHVANRTDAEKVAELEKIRKNRRIIGLKPYPTFGIPYHDPRYDALWDYAQRHGLYVGMHPALWYQSEEFISMSERFPHLQILAYHAGCSYEIADTVIQLCQQFPNIHAEINYSSVTGGIIEYLVNGCGEDRVIYGSDQPLRDPRQQLGWVVYSNLPEAVKIKILYANAAKFLSQFER